MNKLCVFLTFFIFLVFNAGVSNNVAAAQENGVYAKALKECVFYKNQTMTDEIEGVYFLIPESYFVLVIQKFDNCFKVQYKDYVGYVKKENVKVLSFIPVVKTLEGVTLDIKQSAGTQVWTLPSSINGNVLSTIPAGTKNITYIASVYGDIPTGGQSGLWYYVSYTPLSISTNVYTGYVYSENVANISDIIYNTEDDLDVNFSSQNDSDAIYISGTIKTIIVAVITIPIIAFFVIILYKSIKKLQNNAKNVQNLNKLNHEEKYDYYQNHSENFQKYNDLKNNIDHLKQTSFVRKTKPKIKSSFNSYPTFPSYTSDDDLLWFFCSKFFKRLRT